MWEFVFIKCVRSARSTLGAPAVTCSGAACCRHPGRPLLTPIQGWMPCPWGTDILGPAVWGSRGHRSEPCGGPGPRWHPCVWPGSSAFRAALWAGIPVGEWCWRLWGGSVRYFRSGGRCSPLTRVLLAYRSPARGPRCWGLAGPHPGAGVGSSTFPTPPRGAWAQVVGPGGCASPAPGVTAPPWAQGPLICQAHKGRAARGRGCGEHTGLLPCPRSTALALRSVCSTMGSTQQALENGQAVGAGGESRGGRVEVRGAAPSSEVGSMLAHDSLTLCLPCVCILLQLLPRKVAGCFPPPTGPWVCWKLARWRVSGVLGKWRSQQATFRWENGGWRCSGEAGSGWWRRAGPVGAGAGHAAGAY